MKKVAVFLRGNRRVWNYTKENIFAVCDSLADQVDYYVALWYVQKSRPIMHSMKDDFKDKNIKYFNIFESHWNYDAWTGPAYLSSLLNDEKINEEIMSGQQYDAVLDTRPDVVFNKLGTVEKPAPWSLGSTRLEFEKDIYGWQGLEDHVFFSDSPTSSLFSNRMNYKNYDQANGHYKLLKYCNITNLTPFQIPSFESRIVRPTISNQYLSVPPNVAMTPVQLLSNEWDILSLADKISLLEKTGIGLDQYLTGLNLTY